MADVKREAEGVSVSAVVLMAVGLMFSLIAGYVWLDGVYVLIYGTAPAMAGLIGLGAGFALWLIFTILLCLGYKKLHSDVDEKLPKSRLIMTVVVILVVAFFAMLISERIQTNEGFMTIGDFVLNYLSE